MAKLTPTQIENELASSTGLAIDDIRRLLSELAGLAYEHATDGFLLPGFGQFIVSPDEKLYRQPGTGEMIPGPLRLKFHPDSTALESFTRTSPAEPADATPSLIKNYPEIRLTPNPEDVEAAELNLECVSNANNKLGGSPNWIQSPWTPVCCATNMSFFGQFDSSIDDTFNIVDCGMIYVFLCEHCANTKSVFQCG